MNLPKSLIPTDRKRGRSATSYESLTRATLAYLDSGRRGGFTESHADEITRHRVKYARIPGVNS